MKFGSWTYDSSKVNLRFYRDIEKFDLNAYVKSTNGPLLVIMLIAMKKNMVSILEKKAN